MSKIRSKNTTPEIKVWKLLHSMGYRFRLHRKELPGKPDIVLLKYKTVIFVHGFFGMVMMLLSVNYQDCQSRKLISGKRKFLQTRKEILIFKVSYQNLDGIFLLFGNVKHLRMKN